MGVFVRPADRGDEVEDEFAGGRAGGGWVGWSEWDWGDDSGDWRDDSGDGCGSGEWDWSWDGGWGWRWDWRWYGGWGKYGWGGDAAAAVRAFGGSFIGNYIVDKSRYTSYF